jgi:PKD repeat protein
MLKKHIGAGVLALGLLFSVGFIAAPAEASSLTSAQISAILSLLQSFGADQSTINNVSAALNGQATTGTNQSCLTLSYNLYAGLTDSSTNGQVSQLQQFLGVDPTGYFGPMTLQAVQNWQSSHGIVSQGSPDTTGYGFVGPQTRAAMGCGTVPNPVQSTYGQLSISNVSGPNALAVGQQGTWSVSASDVQGAYVSVSVNWGDANQYGSAASPQSASVSQQNTFSHAYQSAGTYTIVFTATDNYGNSNKATATVTVTGSTQNVSFTASPTSGTAPLAVSFNASGLSANANYTVNFGDGTSGQVQLNSSSCFYLGCGSYGGSVSHTYSTSGTYTAVLISSNGTAVGTVTITVSGSYTTASCTWNGQTIGNGQSVTGYQSSSVAYGQSCVSQTLTCSNGTMSGASSYPYASCTVSPAPQSSAPVISSITPTSGPNDTFVTIIGSGFTSGVSTCGTGCGGGGLTNGNEINIDGQALENDQATNNGTTISFTIGMNCSSSAPSIPCSTSITSENDPLTAGTHQITVTNANGTSNTVTFTVTGPTPPLSAKPVIYLYPTKTEQVNVKVNPIDGFTKTDPSYGSGWNVVATPNSVLTNLSDGKTYPYLFWEGINEIADTPQEGFVVAQSDIPALLTQKLALFGLNAQERADFLAFWVPRLSQAPYYFITFTPRSEIDRMAPLSITPQPDTIIRVLMDYKPLDKPISVEPLQITPTGRNGFTVVEWGGIIR